MALASTHIRRARVARQRASGLSRRRDAGLVRLASIVLVLLGACACTDGSGGSRVRTIDAPRVVEHARAGLPTSAASAERSGLVSQAHGKPAHEPGAAGSQAKVTLRWDTPADWVELAPTPLRQANFQVAADKRAECYLTVLSGDAGGLEANINRWHKQISLAPLSASEIAALPRQKLFDREAVEIDVVGTWQGMNGSEQAADYRMVGWLQIDSEGSTFLRLVGPRSVVDREIDAFRPLGASFRRQATVVDAAATVLSATTPRANRGLAWQTPAGWQRAPDRAMREVSFTIGGEPRAEAYVSVLFGEAGGVLANVNRWRKQMGRDPLAQPELDGLPRIPMLGGEALVVEAEGTFTGMDGTEVTGAFLYGTVCQLADSTVFVKLTGPREIVEPERERFLAFCSSLTVAR